MFHILERIFLSCGLDIEGEGIVAMVWSTWYHQDAVKFELVTLTF